MFEMPNDDGDKNSLTDDGDKDGADLPSCEFRTRIKFDISVRDDDPLPLPLPLFRNKWEF